MKQEIMNLLRASILENLQEYKKDFSIAIKFEILHPLRPGRLFARIGVHVLDEFQGFLSRNLLLPLNDGSFLDYFIERTASLDDEAIKISNGVMPACITSM